MNLFPLHEDPEIAARAACDQHVIKIATEVAQMLCYAAYNAGAETTPYKPNRRHMFHGCTLWVGHTMNNWNWTVEYGKALIAERERRFPGREPLKVVPVIQWASFAARRRMGFEIAEGPLEPWYMAFNTDQKPDIVLNGHLDGFAMTVHAYRQYYAAKWLEWLTREKPFPMKWVGNDMTLHDAWNEHAPEVASDVSGSLDLKVWYPVLGRHGQAALRYLEPR